MDSLVIHCQSPLRTSNSRALSKIHLRRQNFSSKEIVAVGALGFAFPNDYVRPLVLRIQETGDWRGISSTSISQSRISALGRIPKDRGNDAEQSSGSKSSKNLQEIISIIRRIRSSIAEESAKHSERSFKSSDEDASLESVLDVLHQLRSSGKPASKEDNNKTLPRPTSSFVRKSPISSFYQEQELVKHKSLSLPVIRDEKRHEFLEEIDGAATMEMERMKLPQLKELAKSKGIKGYSRMKKAELMQLLSTSNKL